MFWGATIVETIKNTEREYVQYDYRADHFIEILANGNPKTRELVRQLKNVYKDEGSQIFDLLKSYGIIGYKLERFVSTCYKGKQYVIDKNMFDASVAFLACNKLPNVIVSKNLNMKHPLPFVDKQNVDKFAVSLTQLRSDYNLRNELGNLAQEISTKLEPEIEEKYQEYFKSLQNI